MLSAFEIAHKVAARELSAESTVQECLQSVHRTNDALGAFLSVDDQAALTQARDIDRRVQQRQPVGLLAGVPVAVKDNICTSWDRTRCASRILADYCSPYDAHVVERLRAADAVIVGKTNMDEFAMGSSTENSAFMPARNPWDRGRVPGGSSGGSAVAVAAGLVPLALGSDTGGSIRQPASFCGVVGLKPGYGRVSRYGLVAFGSSLDQIGPLARDVRDAALVLQVIAGHDARDSTSVPGDVPDYLSALDKPAHKLRIGVAAEYFGEGLDPEVQRSVRTAIDDCADNGAEIIDISMPHLKYAIACYYIIANAEASSNLARFDGVHYGHRSASPGGIIHLYSASRAEGFGAEVKRRIMLGTYVLSSGYYDAYYLKAAKVRTLIKQDFERAFGQVDVIASPASPVVPFVLGERTEDPLAMYLADIYTVATNLAGISGVSIPCGFTSEGLPVGLQLQAPAFVEDRLLQAAHSYQLRSDWHTRRPETHS